MELAPKGVVLLSLMPNLPDAVATWLTGQNRPAAHLKGRLEGRDGEGRMCYMSHVGVLATEMKDQVLPEGVSRWLAAQRRVSEHDKLVLVGPFPRLMKQPKTHD